MLAPGVGDNNGGSQNYMVGAGPGGSLFIGGLLYGRVAFPGLGPQSTSNGSYLGRQSSTGQWEWLTILQSSTQRQLTVYIRDMKTDAQHNIYLVADFSYSNNYNDTLRAGPFLLYGHTFIGKLNATGQWQWVVGVQTATATTIAPDGHGGAFIGGNFDESLRLGSFRLYNPVRYTLGSFLGHVNGAGRWDHAEQQDLHGGDGIQNMALDINGHLVVGGLFMGNTLALSSTAQATGRAGHSNLFVARFDTAARRWEWAASGRGFDRMDEVALDRQGNVFVSGRFYDSISCGSTRLPSTFPMLGTYVARLTSSGQWSWLVKHSGNTYYADQQELAVTATGDVLVSGSIRGDTARFGTQLLQDPPNHHVAYPWGYVARLQGSTGRWQWAVATPNEMPGSFDMLLDSTETSLVSVGGLFPSYAGTPIGTTTLQAPLGTGFVAALTLATRQWRWANGVATGGGAIGAYVRVDAQGNLTASGLLYGEAMFGSIRAFEPYEGIFVGRRSAGGAWQWVVTGTGFWPQKEVGVDQQGNVYLLGFLFGRDDTARLGDRKLTYRPSHRGDINYGLAKITNTGQVAWIRQFWMHAGRFDEQALAVDARGNTTLAGSFWDTLKIDGQRWRSTLVPNTGQRSGDGFVVRFDSQGTLKWINRSTSKLDESWSHIVADRQGGGVTVLGDIPGDTVRLGSLQLINSPTAPILRVMAHLDSLGQWQWLAPIVGWGYKKTTRLAVDPHDNLWVSALLDQGSTSYVLFGNQRFENHLIRPDDSYRYVAHFNRTTRQWDWARSISGLLKPNAFSWGGAELSLPLAFDNQGNAYAAGMVVDSFRWGDTTLLTPPGRHVGMVVKLDSVGRLQWGVHTNGPRGSQTSVWDITPAGPDGVYATGSYGGNVAFGGYSLPSEGLYKGFLATIGNVQPLATPSLLAESSGSMEVWPNPATTVTHLLLPAPAVPGQRVSLYDAMGRLVHHQLLPGGTTSVDLSLADVPPGMYIVRCGQVARQLVVTE